jgi:phosphomannomutase/phosphoglucomutase
VIGYDCRISSYGYAKALANGINSQGIKATITGMGPTPQLYWTLFKTSSQASELFDGGIQVTGSHNPSDMNGFKICIGSQTISGSDIQEIKENIKNLISAGIEYADNEVKEIDVQEDYIKDLSENCKNFMGEKKLKVVVDAGNGVGGIVGPAVLRNLGVEVIELYCEPDGSFPNHHPDPTEPHNLVDLIAKVKESNADFGIGFDGDADRIGAVDENGKIIPGDMLVLLYARSILPELQGAPIIGDVKCSELLFKDIEDQGGKAVMWKTGHSLMKKKLKELAAPLAGEMSGHIFFKHRFYGFDDAIYCSARLAEILSKSNKTLSEMFSDLPKMYSTPEIRVDCPEDIKFKIAEKAKDVFNDYKVDTTDGARITFESGWGLVRASNTQSILVMRFEAKSQELVDKYQKLVMEKIEGIKAELTV